MQKIVVLNYGTGNIFSIVQALYFVTPESKIIISNKARDIRSADRIIFPGQGSISYCIKTLKKLDIYNEIVYAALNKPLLGICLGIQILFEYSDECCSCNGLGILKGHVSKFNFKKINNNFNSLFKIPHIGWNTVKQTSNHILWNGIKNNSYFYFVHSYYVVPKNILNVMGETFYGFNFTSAISDQNIFAIQFHPEKSSYFGLQIYKNFINWKP